MDDTLDPRRILAPWLRLEDGGADLDDDFDDDDEADDEDDDSEEDEEDDEEEPETWQV